jgi:ABC-type multidrug transport system fused ATPase/permease subunit
MKKQIKRLSPHQNGKVFGVLMAVATLPMFIPMILMMSFAIPNVDSNGNPIDSPMFMFLIFPFIYVIFGYISVALTCLVYNFLQKFIGGFEYETNEKVEVENA